MALHQVKLPKSATELFMIVKLQKELLRALADPNLNGDDVDTAWVQNVWSSSDPEWVRKFCLGGQEARIRAIAQATPAARQALYDEFCRQHRVKAMLNTGGNFLDLSGLTDFTDQLAITVKEFFYRCYKLLSDDSNRRWKGYEFNGGRSITNRAYKGHFCKDYPTK